MAQGSREGPVDSSILLFETYLLSLSTSLATVELDLIAV